MFQFLLEKGANIEARTADGWTPLHSASNWGNSEVIAILLSHGAIVNAQTNGCQTALHLAAANSESKETIELLLNTEGVDHGLKNNLGETAKDVAVRLCPHHSLFENIEAGAEPMT